MQKLIDKHEQLGFMPSENTMNIVLLRRSNDLLELLSVKMGLTDGCDHVISHVCKQEVSAVLVVNESLFLTEQVFSIFSKNLW